MFSLEFPDMCKNFPINSLHGGDGDCLANQTCGTKDLESEENGLPRKRLPTVDVWAFKFENNHLQFFRDRNRFVCDGWKAPVCISSGCASRRPRWKYFPPYDTDLHDLIKEELSGPMSFLL